MGNLKVELVLGTDQDTTKLEDMENIIHSNGSGLTKEELERIEVEEDE